MTGRFCEVAAQRFDHDVSIRIAIGNAAGRFDQKLSIERQILHVVNRLTFGPHAGDIEQVRRIGVEKWIDLQLHPDRISENPWLEAKLKPLETLQLTVWQIQEKYPAVPPAIAAFRPPSVAAMQSLTPLQSTALFQGSVAERQTMLASLPPETRRLVLGAAPPQTLEGLPADLQQEAANARQADQEAGAQGNVIFYLATPPAFFDKIACQLAAAGLTKDDPGAGWKGPVGIQHLQSKCQRATRMNCGVSCSVGENEPGAM